MILYQVTLFKLGIRDEMVLRRLTIFIFYGSRASWIGSNQLELLCNEFHSVSVRRRCLPLTRLPTFEWKLQIWIWIGSRSKAKEAGPDDEFFVKLKDTVFFMHPEERVDRRSSGPRLNPSLGRRIALYLHHPCPRACWPSDPVPAIQLYCHEQRPGTLDRF